MLDVTNAADANQPVVADQPAGVTSPDLTNSAVDGSAGLAPDQALSPVGDVLTSDGTPPFEWNDAVYSALGFQTRDGEPWALYEEDPEIGTLAYRDLDALRKGAREKQRHILKQQQALEATARRAMELEQRLEEKERDITLFSQRLTDDQLDELFTRKYLAEAHPEFKDVQTEDDLADPAQRAQFRKAAVEARAKVLFERQQLEAERTQEEALYKEQLKQTEEYYTARMHRDNAAAVWGTRNTEEVSALNEFLMRPSGRSRHDGQPATLAEEIFDVAVRNGPAVADVLVVGLRSHFWNLYKQGAIKVPDTPKPPPSVQPSPQPPAPVERVIDKTSPPPAPAASELKPKPTDARSRIREGFLAARNAPGARR